MLNTANYQIVDRVYEGSDTVLYRGIRNSDGAQIAIKVLRNEYPSTRDLARLRHEFSILSEIQCPGVIRAFGLEKYGNSIALIMEPARGWPLSDVLRTMQLSLPVALQFAVKLADIIQALHSQGVIHKDIKPQAVN